MGALNPTHMNNSIERYQNLKLKESLSKPYQFTLACNELSYILRNAYSKFPKNLQLIIFQETLFAFSILPQVQTQSSIVAANSLLQSAEFALPKQKRGLAVKEYKQALVACKRKSKSNQDEQGSILLPQDVLVHIFSFLDLQSLVSASAVSWSWNDAARDNHLWKFLYTSFFCNSNKISKQIGLKTSGPSENKEETHLHNGIDSEIGIEWRRAFRTAFEEIYSRKLRSHRGYCSSCCSIVWLTSNKCSEKHPKEEGSNHQIRPISTQQVTSTNPKSFKIFRSRWQIVEYILDGVLSAESSSDSDSDSDDNEDVSLFKLWAYPKHRLSW
ncbi:hypothetical protein ACJIZ3_009033 [Penstemon smallii]|uniref:F-box domain-containing protein n=1 Tax=Penstemon smallii TaxID=265156 RepID=A0ABD3TBW3_9LAMI